MKVPVLTYHSMNINGDTYCQNDHLAFASDLETINELGFRVISLKKVVDWQLGLLPDDVTLNTVAITFDDGSWFDFYDLDHPDCGLQRSMFNCPNARPSVIAPPTRITSSYGRKFV